MIEKLKSHGKFLLVMLICALLVALPTFLVTVFLGGFKALIVSTIINFVIGIVGYYLTRCFVVG